MRAVAAIELELAEVPVIVIDGLTDDQRRALVLADNKLPLHAGWDEDMLRQELEALAAVEYDLGSVGFEDEELESCWQLRMRKAASPTRTQSPRSAARWFRPPGDVWVLGDHRLICGDATAPADAAKLMEGEAADLVLTDPPYNVDYQGYTKDKLKIKGDCMNPEDFRKFLSSAFSTCRAIVKPGGLCMFFMPRPGSANSRLRWRARDLTRCQLVWVKNTFAWGFARYKFQHEPIFYAHVAKEKDCWYGDKSQSRCPGFVLFWSARSISSTGFAVGCTELAAGLFSCQVVEAIRSADRDQR